LQGKSLSKIYSAKKDTALILDIPALFFTFLCSGFGETRHCVLWWSSSWPFLVTWDRCFTCRLPHSHWDIPWGNIML